MFIIKRWLENGKEVCICGFISYRNACVVIRAKTSEASVIFKEKNISIQRNISVQRSVGYDITFFVSCTYTLTLFSNIYLQAICVVFCYRKFSDFVNKFETVNGNA